MILVSRTRMSAKYLTTNVRKLGRPKFYTSSVFICKHYLSLIKGYLHIEIEEVINFG